MARVRHDLSLQPRLDSAAIILSFLFGLSVAIAVLDRLPISPSVPISVYRVVHVPIFIGIIFLLFSRGQIRWTAYNPTLFLLAGFALSMILSTFSAAHQFAAFLELMRYLEYSFIAVLLFLVIRNYWQASYWIAFSWAMLLTALFSSITILTDFWNVTGFYRWYTAERPYVRHMGILGEANYGAAKLCVLLPFILFLESWYIRRREWGKVFCTTGAGVVVVLAIFVSGSRMGGLIAAVILGGFFLKEIRWLRQPKVLLILSGALGLLVAALFSLPQQPLLQASRYLTDRYGIVVNFLQTGEEQFREVRETSIQERIDVSRAGLQMFTARPLLGVGPGNFPLVIGDYDPDYSAVYSHNTYLSVLAELGIAGFFFFILLCGRMLVSTYRLSQSPASGSWSFYRFLFVSLLVLFLVFFFLHDLDSKYFWTLFLPVALFADSQAHPTGSARSSYHRYPKSVRR